MSVQLIVYPQSLSSTEVLVNGISFTGLNTSSSYDSNSAVNTLIDVITNAPPTLLNTWYRFRTILQGTPTLPTVTAGDLVLNSNNTITLSGVYQRLSNLIIGKEYNFIINVSNTASTGQIVISIYDETTEVQQASHSPALSQITDSFIASSTQNIIFVSYLNVGVDNVTISDISISSVSGSTPSNDVNLLSDGQVILDLYEEEDLPLTLSVENFKNVAENVASYSKAFNLPATKRNNKAFDSIFEITRDYQGIVFNPYQKTKCILKQDGLLLFKGYLRLLDITDKEGEISYNVNLYSEVVALADTLKDRAFRDLDFTELEHDYNKSEIKRSWNDAPSVGITYTNPSTSGFRDANSTVKYPFVDWNHQFIVAPINSSATAGNPQLSFLEQAFRPFINIKYLIDRIFEASDFTYKSTFISNDEDFNKLYMDFNWGSSISPVTGYGSLASGDPLTYSTGNWENLNWYNTSFPDEAGWSDSNGYFTCPTDGTTYTIDYNFSISNIASPNLQLEIDINNTTGIPDVTISQWTMQIHPATIPFTGSHTFTLNAGDTWAINMKANAGASFQNFSNLTVTTNLVFATSNTLLQTLRGELGQWDFLKGLITMFNLITLPDEDNPNNIIIEPYGDVFVNTGSGESLASRGIQHDWTDKIDVSQMKLEPLADLNKNTIFKFAEDDDDYSFNQYKNQVGGHLYGSKKYDAWNSFDILEGKKEIVVEPFAATLVKQLMPQYSQFIIPAIYARGDDGVSEAFDNSPRIMYNNGIKDTGASFYIPPQNGGTSSNTTDFLQFSHLTDIPTIIGSPPIPDTRDFHFGECQLMPGVGDATPNNLFNLFWLPYYSQLYNPNTRIMTIKVNLNASDINLFKFNDKVFLKNRVFRCNRIDYKPNDLSTVEFILIT